MIVYRPRRVPAQERTPVTSTATHAAVFQARAGVWTPKAPPSRVTTSERAASRARPTHREPRWVQLAMPWGMP